MKDFYAEQQQDIPEGQMSDFLTLTLGKAFHGRFIKKEKKEDSKFGNTTHWYFEVLEDYPWTQTKTNKDTGEETKVSRVAKVGEVVILNKKHVNKGKEGGLVATRFFIQMKDNEILPGDELKLVQSGKGFDTVYGIIPTKRGPNHDATPEPTSDDVPPPSDEDADEQ